MMYNLNNMSQCSEQSTQLSSENTSRTWDLMPKSTHTHLMNIGVVMCNLFGILFISPL
jgi:hypothetical protein